DDGSRLGNETTITFDVLSNEAPTLSPTESSSQLTQFGKIATDEIVTFEANASDADGEISRWEFTFGYRWVSGQGWILNTSPDIIEWKGGFDQNRDGEIGIIGTDSEGNVLDERFDYALDGNADGIVNYQYDSTGNFVYRATAFDNHLVRSTTLSSIEVVRPAFVNLNAEGEVINPGDPLILADASGATSGFGQIIKYEFDFEYNSTEDNLDGENDEISSIEYTEWKGGFDHNNDGIIDASESIDRADDGTFDGKFTGEYYYADETPRDVSVVVKVTDDLGNTYIDSDTIRINSNPDAGIQVTHANPKQPGTLVLIDSGWGVTTDDQDRTAWPDIEYSGISEYLFNIYEVGDVDGNGTANELITTYTERQGTNTLYSSITDNVTTAENADAADANIKANAARQAVLDGGGTTEDADIAYQNAYDNARINSYQFEVSGFYTSPTFDNYTDFNQALIDFNSSFQDSNGNYMDPGDYAINVTMIDPESGALNFSGNGTINAPDGTWSGNFKYTFPEQGLYRVHVKATDFFGLSDEAETTFQTYEGVPQVAYSITQADQFGDPIAPVLIGTGNVLSFNPDSPMTFDASATTIPDGQGQVLEYKFDYDGDNKFEYAEKVSAGADGIIGTADDIYSAFNYETNQSTTFDGTFDGKFT
ncbi:MAG: hypothetical protein ACPGO6_07215, partial [Candidatus Poseidoniaceae archaeon]